MSATRRSGWRRGAMARLALAITVGTLVAACAPGPPAEFSRVPASVVDAARRDGHVRVIVQLQRAPDLPIAQAQDQVLAELSGTRTRILQRYLTSAALALDVGEDALVVLDRSPHVTSIAGDFDMQRRPSGSGN